MPSRITTGVGVVLSRTLILLVLAGEITAAEDAKSPQPPAVAPPAAANPATKPAKNKADHWAFKPVARPALPVLNNSTAALRNPIDTFIVARLAERGLALSPEASRRTLIRRLYFTLIGLPPAPAEVDAFLSDSSPSAYERVVDQLLDSPRYGERWARHWLDIIAFGETHGFEVNTPRNNAWPYRDYVIRALNQDKPFPQFIKDQLAGDITGEDAATGFIVAKAALLPGQTGRDEESIRLARQDELADMVLGAGGAFLGLTVNCARCHDHKFDPISQTDYYAMAAVFAGVQHGERPLRTAESQARRREAEALKPQLAETETALMAFEPLARPEAPALKPTNAKFNEEHFQPVLARFVRFTIHDVSLHPSLGPIEPCIDEFEIFSAGPDSRNVALATAGTKVTASGSTTSASHQLEHIHDGRYGNSRSWMSDETSTGWVLFELPALTRIDRIVWSRDREGQYSDRLATAYTLEAGGTLESLQTVPGASGAPLRPAVHPRRTIDRFSPVAAKRLRFTILECSSLEPCLDELEVFTSGTGSRNVALAGLGTRVRASGTIAGSEIHRLDHINDGRFGNGRSWISSESGKGWVELEFPQTVTIDHVVWGRDREEKYTDRMPTNYRIEVAREGSEWQAVATSQDRRRYVPGGKNSAAFSLAELSAEEARNARALLAKKQSLEKRIKELETGQVVYAGKFTPPSETYRLHRGDPMQRKEIVAPGTLSSLAPKLELPANASDPERRLALAEWIADPRNPLTARVLVNRLWHHHFGEGLVNTPSDFGQNGARPVNPELLDWLASEFVERGWSIKAMHKLIVTSATFRQSSQPNPQAQAIDAGTRLLWRFPPRRLEAETIRDLVLAVCGTLDLRMSGPGYSAFEPNDNYVRVYDPRKNYGPAEWRRMIYQTKVRMAQDSTFGVFDCPDAGQNQPRRPRSTTPLQALSLFNSQFVNQQSALFARRLQAEAGTDCAAQVQLGYRLAFNRKPDEAEERLCAELVRHHGLAALCRVMLNANEFIFVN